jgi:hypothetical protein
MNDGTAFGTFSREFGREIAELEARAPKGGKRAIKAPVGGKLLTKEQWTKRVSAALKSKTVLAAVDSMCASFPARMRAIAERPKRVYKNDK